jgi:uncharacterized membrane protein YfcA
MDALSLPELLFFSFVIILSYAIRGSAGFGGVTVPLLAWVMSLKTVVPMVTFLGLLSSAAILRTEYKHIVWRDLWRVMPWCVLGVAIGLYFFKVLDSRTLAQALGIFVIAYGVYAWWASDRHAPGLALPMYAVTPTAGTTAGFVGTIFGSMAGMFFAIYLDLLRHAKHEFRATVAGILFALGLFRGAGYISVGAYDRDALIACAAALPLMALGIFIGNRVHANLAPLAFKRLVALILIASGVPLLVR